MSEHCKEPSDSTPTGWIPSDSSWPKLLSPDEREQILFYLDQRFGLPAFLLEEYWLFKKRDACHILRKSSLLDKAFSFKPAGLGLKAFHRIGGYIKPSTSFIQIFGTYAQKGKYALQAEELEKFLAKEPIETRLTMDNGYVILTLGQCVLGMGLLVEGRVQPQIRRQNTNLFRDVGGP